MERVKIPFLLRAIIVVQFVMRFGIDLMNIVHIADRKWMEEWKMKSVMISIHPKWCDLIASRKKTVEIRRTRPRIEIPFKCYIYCTLQGMNEAFASWEKDIAKYNRENWSERKGKVIGEFLCNEIDEFESEFWDDDTYERIVRIVHEADWEGFPDIKNYYVAENGEENYLCKKSCLSWDELRRYVGQGCNTFYGWHISDINIYDNPKELCEFYKHDKTYDNAFGWAFEDRTQYVPITRPPQSWMYVEDKTWE